MNFSETQMLPAMPGSATSANRGLGLVTAWLRAIRAQVRRRRKKRTLRLCETLSLGEKRFLAVVRVDRKRFLLGGAGNSVSLLTELPARAESDDVEDGKTVEEVKAR
jgi:flagellar biogenesis protein FliO